MYHALIRTHHITSRKKVAALKAALKAAAKTLQCHAVLRSGGIPGVVSVEGRNSTNVEKWVDTAHDLRYKDYQLVAAVFQTFTESRLAEADIGSLNEVNTVKELGALMEEKGLTRWWRVSMGYAHD